MKYVVEKGVPIPSKQDNPKYQRYPWPIMEVGDSVFFDGVKKGAASNQACAARAWGRNQKVKKVFIAQKQENGVRIWRIE